ncbi:hypothetical protein [Prescottella subtropica]|uniref:hypothetical protein n=1 Tax=Prescottella subtropica TaxID=2545757 RepID=UPI0010F773D2|nr:hypothetical protein [Prescottella subtropica]
MPEHAQMQPPDYHRCLETVFASPAGCRELLERLSAMTDAEIESRWSPWKDQEPPPYGPQVKRQVPVEVQLAMLQVAYDDYRESTMTSTMMLWRRLSDIMGIPVMQESLTELVWSVGRRIERLEGRIAELEGTTPSPVRGEPDTRE